MTNKIFTEKQNSGFLVLMYRGWEALHERKMNGCRDSLMKKKFRIAQNHVPDRLGLRIGRFGF